MFLNLFKSKNSLKDFKMKRTNDNNYQVEFTNKKGETDILYIMSMKERSMFLNEISSILSKDKKYIKYLDANKKRKIIITVKDAIKIINTLAKYKYFLTPDEIIFSKEINNQCYEVFLGEESITLKSTKLNSDNNEYVDSFAFELEDLDDVITEFSNILKFFHNKDSEDNVYISQTDNFDIETENELDTFVNTVKGTSTTDTVCIKIIAEKNESTVRIVEINYTSNYEITLLECNYIELSKIIQRIKQLQEELRSEMEVR